MTDPQLDTPVMALDDFIRDYDAQPFEWVDGEKRILAPTMYEHGDVGDNLHWALSNLIGPQGLGKLFTETPFVLEYTRDWVRGSHTPDLIFVTAERLALYQQADPDYRLKPLALVPDLAIEIASPTDSYSEVVNKALGYLADSVRLVWIFDVKRRRVAVYQQGESSVMMPGSDDSLTGGDVLPGFAVNIGTVFQS